jgi:hypothetical protein
MIHNAQGQCITGTLQAGSIQRLLTDQSTDMETRGDIHSVIIISVQSRPIKSETCSTPQPRHHARL